MPAFQAPFSRIETERKTQQQSPIKWTGDPKAERPILEVDKPSGVFGEIPQSVQYLETIESVQFAKDLEERHFAENERDLVPFGFQDDPLFPLLERQVGGDINVMRHGIICRMRYGFSISTYH